MQQSEYKNIFTNEESHFYYVGYHTILISLLNKVLKSTSTKKITILDAGCGTGFFTKKLTIFGKVIGIDANKQAVEFTKSRGLQSIQADIQKLPFQQGLFDLITSIDVICHRSIKADIAVYREFHRLLKKDGIILIKLPAFNWLYGSHDKTVMTKHRYTLSEVKTTLQEAGFKPIILTYIGSFLVPLILISNILHKFTQATEHSSVFQLWTPLNYLFILLFKIEELILRYTSIPMGITLVVIAKKE